MVVAMHQNSTAGITARMVRRHFEVRGNYKRDALKPHEQLIEKLVQTVVGLKKTAAAAIARSSSSRRCESITTHVQLLVFEGELPELSVSKIFAELETRLGVRAGIDYDKGWLRALVDDLLMARREQAMSEGE